MKAVTSGLLGIVVWAAVAEFLLLRVFLRLGPFLPAEEALLPLYRLVEILGLAALNLAVLAAAVLAASISVGLVVRRSAGHVLMGLALASALVANLGLGLLLNAIPAPLATMLYAASMMVAVGAVGVWRSRALRHESEGGGNLTPRPPSLAGKGEPSPLMTPPSLRGKGVGGLGSPPLNATENRSGARGRLAISLMAAAQGLALYHVLTQAAGGVGLRLPGTGLPMFLAEGLALAAALALPWSFRVRPSRRQVGLGLGLALVFFLGYLARPWTVATMTMWTISFTLFLPGLLYAAGLAAGLTTLLALRAEPATRSVAAGLLLVALAGLRLDFTYAAIIGLIGLLAACQLAFSTDDGRRTTDDGRPASWRGFRPASSDVRR